MAPPPPARGFGSRARWGTAALRPLVHFAARATGHRCPPLRNSIQTTLVLLPSYQFFLLWRLFASHRSIPLIRSQLVCVRLGYVLVRMFCAIVLLVIVPLTTTIRVVCVGGGLEGRKKGKL